MGDLETLKAITALGFLADDIKDRVDELSSLSIVWETMLVSRKRKRRSEKLTSLRPVVTSPGLTKDEVIGTEQSSKRTGPDRVHGTRFEINKDGTRDVFVRCNV